MDGRTFDRFTAAVAHRPTRRVTLRLLAGSLVTGLLAQRGAAPARARQRSDRDGDGLYDDDEVNIYGTNPDVYDTDGDGVGDGEEIYVGTDPLTPAGGGGGGLPDGVYDSAPPPYVDPVDPCALQGLTNCGGVCVDLSTSFGHCGACDRPCGYGTTCQGGQCPMHARPAGQVFCDYCTDLYSDVANCGACSNACPVGFLCCGGICVDISSDGSNCGGCGLVCFGGYVCENYQCV